MGRSLQYWSGGGTAGISKVAPDCRGLSFAAAPVNSTNLTQRCGSSRLLRMIRFGWVAVYFVVSSLGSALGPAEWVPARCAGSDPRDLARFAGTAVNYVLVRSYNTAFTREAAARGISVLAVVTPAADPVGAVRRAMSAKLAGVVLEGDFSSEVVAQVRDALAGAPLIELTSRNRMTLDSPAPVIGTYEGVWPGAQVVRFGDGSVRAGATGSTWVDTNSGLIRAARALSHATVWLGNRPPSAIIDVVPGERYLQAIADAEIAGGR